MEIVLVVVAVAVSVVLVAGAVWYWSRRGVGRWELWCISRMCNKAVKGMERARLALERDRRKVEADKLTKEAEDERRKLRVELKSPASVTSKPVPTPIPTPSLPIERAIYDPCKVELEKTFSKKEAAKRNAKQSLDSAYSRIKGAEELGINVSSAKDLHKKGIVEFDNGEYEKAMEHAENCKKTVKEEIRRYNHAKERRTDTMAITVTGKEERRYNHAKEQIKASKDIVESVKRITSIPKADDLIEEAESALKVGDFYNAVKFAKQVKREALRLKGDYEAYKETANFISSTELEITNIKSSGVKISESDELIKQAKAELSKNNFEKAKELAEEAKRVASERKGEYNLASRSIYEVERTSSEISSKGVIVLGGEELLLESKQAFDDGYYRKAISLTQKLADITNEVDIKYIEASDWIKSAESVIGKSKEFGCDISEVEELLTRARTGFEEGNYAQAISDASKSEKVAKEIKEKAKPEIEVDLSEKTFQPNVWEEISLNIFNKGNAHAKDIDIGFSEEVKVKGLEIIERLDVGEETELEVSFKPVDVGERVPLEISTRFEDLDGKRYGERETVNISVGGIKREVVKERIKELEIPIEKKERALIIERAIYDPCKGDFIERALPRMKEWVNSHDPSAYWFAISLQNNADKAIEEWGVELETSAALKIKEAKIEGIEIEIPHEAHLGLFKISVPKEYGIVIPKGGAQRVYFKLRAEKPKTTYEIRGVFKSAISGDVPIRAKEFKYLCDAVSLRGAILEHPETALEYVETQVNRYSYSPAEVSAIVKGVDIVSGICRMCESRYPKRADVRSEVENLKEYLENVEDKLGRSYKDFEMLVREMDAVLFEATVPEDYAEKTKRRCLVFPDDLLAKLQRQSIERGG